MGTTESTLSRSQGPAGDVITTVSERVEGVDPVLEQLRSLNITPPILESPLVESGLSDILVKKLPSFGSRGAALDFMIMEEVENKVELADALASKLLQHFNHSVPTMKTTAQHLSEVHKLQVEHGELKGRLTEVISNCDAICKRITLEGPDSFRASVAPLASVARVGQVNKGKLLAKGSPSDKP